MGKSFFSAFILFLGFVSCEAAAPAQIRLRVVNQAFDLRFMGAGDSDDLAGAGRRLAGLKPDIVSLQGLWASGDRAQILGALKAAGLSHHRYFRSGMFGSGILLVSRFPVRRSFFSLFSVRGEPFLFREPDYYAGHGFALYEIETRSGSVYVAGADLQKPYGSGRYDGERLSQLVELAGAFSRSAPPLIISGRLGYDEDASDLRAVASRAAWRTASGSNGGGGMIVVRDGDEVSTDFDSVESGPGGSVLADISVSPGHAYRPQGEAPPIDAAKLDAAAAESQTRLEMCLVIGVVLLLVGTLSEAYLRRVWLRVFAVLCLCSSIFLFWYGMYHLDGQINGYQIALEYVSGNPLP